MTIVDHLLHKGKVMVARQQIESALKALYQQVFNEGRADLFSSLLAGPYIQHNPLFPNGLEPLVGYLQQVGNLPCEVKRTSIDGDLAFVHVRYLNWGGKEHAGVDIFRFNDEGNIVEHWDVLQPVADVAANGNTMF